MKGASTGVPFSNAGCGKVSLCLFRVRFGNVLALLVKYSDDRYLQQKLSAPGRRMTNRNRSLSIILAAMSLSMIC